MFEKAILSSRALSLRNRRILASFLPELFAYGIGSASSISGTVRSIRFFLAGCAARMTDIRADYYRFPFRKSFTMPMLSRSILFGR